MNYSLIVCLISFCIFLWAISPFYRPLYELITGKLGVIEVTSPKTGETVTIDFDDDNIDAATYIRYLEILDENKSVADEEEKRNVNPVQN